jgi:hypothetical protein
VDHDERPVVGMVGVEHDVAVCLRPHQSPLRRRRRDRPPRSPTELARTCPNRSPQRSARTSRRESHIVPDQVLRGGGRLGVPIGSSALVRSVEPIGASDAAAAADRADYGASVSVPDSSTSAGPFRGALRAIEKSIMLHRRALAKRLTLRICRVDPAALRTEGANHISHLCRASLTSMTALDGRDSNTRTHNTSDPARHATTCRGRHTQPPQQIASQVQVGSARASP